MKDTTPSPDRIIVWLAGQMKGKRRPAWGRLWDFLRADPYFTHRIPRKPLLTYPPSMVFKEESPMATKEHEPDIPRGLGVLLELESLVDGIILDKPIEEESPMTPTHPTGAGQQAPKPAERILLCFGGSGGPHPFTTHKVTPGESPMTHPIDGTPAGPEQPPWPGDPTREKLPPLTAPLVKEYVNRIRLMERAFELAQKACRTVNKETVKAVYHFEVTYKAILQSLLEEAGLSQPEGTDGKDQAGS